MYVDKLRQMHTTNIDIFKVSSTIYNGFKIEQALIYVIPNVYLQHGTLTAIPNEAWTENYPPHQSLLPEKEKQGKGQPSAETLKKACLQWKC